MRCADLRESITTRSSVMTEGVGTLGRRAHRRCDCDHIRVSRICGHVNSVAGGKEGIETLYEVWIAVEEHGDAFDDPRRVDARWGCI